MSESGKVDAGETAAGSAASEATDDNKLVAERRAKLAALRAKDRRSTSPPTTLASAS